MEKVAWNAIRDRFGEKLGRCPFCMRASLLGALAAWFAAFVQSAASTGPIFVAATVILASAFTLVALSHVTAHAYRVARSLRAYEFQMRSEASAAYRIPRREFLTTVMRAGAGFALMAAFGRSIRIGSAQGCGPVSPVNQICADGQTEQEARDKLAAATDAACDTLCEGLGGCAKGSKCLRSGLAAYNAPSECSPNARGGVTCCVRVTCPCACFSCDDVVPADTLAIGTGDNKGDAWSAMLADAKNKCEAFCKKVDSCPDKKPTCRLNGTAKVKAKQADDCKQDPITHKWTCKGTIEKCPCKCGK